MADFPNDKKEASAKRYGTWSGKPSGHPYDPTKCAAQVWAPGEFVGRQCQNRPGAGPDGIFCRIHSRALAKMNELWGRGEQ